MYNALNLIFRVHIGAFSKMPLYSSKVLWENSLNFKLLLKVVFSGSLCT